MGADAKMEERLRAAGQACQNGCTCSQAVFCAFAGELGLEEAAVYRLMESFGGGRPILYVLYKTAVMIPNAITERLKQA